MFFLTANKHEDTKSEDHDDSGKVLAELDSSRAFAEFLSRRGAHNYQVPEFLADVIKLPNSNIKEKEIPKTDAGEDGDASVDNNKKRVQVNKRKTAIVSATAAN